MVKEKRFFPWLEKTNSGILSNRVYCMCRHIFVFPCPPFFPNPNQFLMGLLYYSMETA